MINSLDEAIKHCEEVEESCERGNPKKRGKSKCASEHRQLAEWLRELKNYGTILDELKDEITRAHNDLIESENEYGENARYTENDRGYLGGLLHAYEMFGREYEEVNADEDRT